MFYTNAVAEQRPELEMVVKEHLGLKPDMFIAQKLFPVITSDKDTGSYHKWEFKELDKQILDTKRAAHSGYNRIEQRTSKASFSTSEDGLEYSLDDVESSIMPDFFDIEAQASNVVSFNLLREFEIETMNSVFGGSSIVSTSQAAALAWTDPASDPRKDIKLAKNKMKKKMGGLEVPGASLVLVIAEDTLDALEALDEIKERIKYTRSIDQGDLGTGVLARYLKVDQIVVGKARINGDLIMPTTKGLLALVSGSPLTSSIPRLGNTFLYTKYSPNFVNIETYRDETKKSDIVRAFNYKDANIVSGDCGCLITGI